MKGDAESWGASQPGPSQQSTATAKHSCISCCVCGHSRMQGATRSTGADVELPTAPGQQHRSSFKPLRMMGRAERRRGGHARCSPILTTILSSMTAA